MDIGERLREVELEIGSRRAEHQIDPTLDRVAALVSLLGDPHRLLPLQFVPRLLLLQPSRRQRLQQSRPAHLLRKRLQLLQLLLLLLRRGRLFLL